MRIVGGEWRGHSLLSPKGQETRPTSDSHKESLFNILEHHYGFDFENVLDLFAGTGALGFEALSRGAQRLCLVDSAPRALDVMERNRNHLPLSPTQEVAIIKRDLMRQPLSLLSKALDPAFLPFRLIFCDPPYGKKGLEKVLRHFEREEMKVFHPEALLIAEIGKTDDLSLKGWSVERELVKGVSRFLFCRKLLK